MSIIDITNYKKIAISGGHGVGKTTLAKRMSQEFGFYYAPEVAREIINSLPTKFDWQTSKKNIYKQFELAILHTHVFYMRAFAEPFISDRSIYDIAAYCYQRGLSNLARKIMYLYNRDGYKLYDCILLYENGYCEPHNLTSQQILFKIKQIFEYRKIQYISINKGDSIIYSGKKIEI